jgi:thiamine biosynthesis protein ThiI
MDAAEVRSGLLVRQAPELTLKSNKVRRRFQRLLGRNLRDALASGRIAARMRPIWDGFFVETSQPDEAISPLEHVAGVAKIVRVDCVVPAELDLIVRAGQEAFSPRVAGKRFAVRTRRTGRHSFRSHDVDLALGAALRPYADRVDLTDPEVTIHVEIRNDRAYLYCDTYAGLGGLPLGSQGKAVALISGGFDSAVAAWFVLRRGVALDYLFCNLGGKAYERLVLQVAKVLADYWSFGTRPRFFTVDFAPLVAVMRERVRPAYWQVVLKRLMYRAGALLARHCRALTIVTGESIGQVSSQTLHNLRAIEAGLSIPVLRPLVAYDKEEIIRLARKIGTAVISERVREYCALTPEHPVTRSSPQAVDAAMEGLDLSLVDRQVEAAAVYDLRTLADTDLVVPFVYIDHIPPGAVVIDCQPKELFLRWHYPGAENHDPWQLSQQFHCLSRERTYVLYCPLGVQTATIAEQMQQAGYEAYSFRGGTPALRAYLAQQAEAGTKVPG